MGTTGDPSTIAILDEMLDSGHLLKDPAPWGFVIYRCSYRDEAAWQKTLAMIHESVKEDVGDRTDILSKFKPTVIEDPKLDGATSHEIRDHFSSWVASELKRLTLHPERLNYDAIIKNDPDETAKSDQPPLLLYGPRYCYCVFVDDICLESHQYMLEPVVKLLDREWGHLDPSERDYAIHPEWEDGKTDDPEEYVGWIYLEAVNYIHLYICLHGNPVAYDKHYERPPQMVCDPEILPGSWRKSKQPVD